MTPYPALARRSKATDTIAVEARLALAELAALRAAVTVPDTGEQTHNDAWHRELATVFHLIHTATIDPPPPPRFPDRHYDGDEWHEGLTELFRLIGEACA